MQKVNIVCIGKIKEDFYRSALAEYLKRLSRFAKVEVKELAEGRSIEEEAAPVLKACKGFVFALCIEGERFSSEKLAQNIKKLCDKGEEMTFVIGSSCGLSDKVKDNSDIKLSFSDMTSPHQLMRVILAEQLYRAFMINSGSEYHK